MLREDTHTQEKQGATRVSRRLEVLPKSVYWHAERATLGTQLTSREQVLSEKAKKRQIIHYKGTHRSGACSLRPTSPSKTQSQLYTTYSTSTPRVSNCLYPKKYVFCLKAQKSFNTVGSIVTVSQRKFQVPLLLFLASNL